MRNFLTPPPRPAVLQAAAATAREAHNTLDAKLAAESGYRERAETGWEAAQQALDGVEAELQETRSKVATLEGKLSASEGLAASANTLNAYIERDKDALMERTRSRPLPSGLIEPRAALVFGLVLGVLSTTLLYAVSGAPAALVGVASILFYVFVYTVWLKPLVPTSSRNPNSKRSGLKARHVFYDYLEPVT